MAYVGPKRVGGDNNIRSQLDYFVEWTNQLLFLRKYFRNFFKT